MTGSLIPVQASGNTVIPTILLPFSDAIIGTRPTHLFGAYYSPRTKGLRYIRYQNLNETLVFIDGYCIDEGRPHARAGYGLVTRPVCAKVPANDSILGFRLEKYGFDGIRYPQTTIRAVLRAAIVILSFRQWKQEGVERLVIACDSVYFFRCATDWVVGWQLNGWFDNNGVPIADQDLWKEFLLEVRSAFNRGLDLRLWWIPRHFNVEADSAAQLGCRLEVLPCVGANDETQQ